MEKQLKLLRRPVEEDTLILNESVVLFKDTHALMELWSWSGVTATSVVFLKEDFEGQSQEQVIDFVFKHLQAPRDPKTTFKEVGDYLYVNFNFKVPDYE